MGLQATAFQTQSEKLVPLYKDALSYYQMIGLAGTLLLLFAGGAFAFTRLKPDFRARNKVERLVMLGLLLGIADCDHNDHWHLRVVNL